MGLFDKKHCDVCGEKIGLLGNRKLEDGNLCKDCAKKLSPFFSERRASTVEEIKQQLAYREENQRQLSFFNPTQIYGTDKKVYVDGNAQKFIVTSASDWRNTNPDIIELSQVTSCDVIIDVDKDEITYTDEQGNRRSYNPPRYKCEYRFDVIIGVNSPWFSQIKFELTKFGHRPDSRYTDEYREYERQANEIKCALMPAMFGGQPFMGASHGQQFPYQQQQGFPQQQPYQQIQQGYAQPAYAQPQQNVQYQQPVQQTGMWVCQNCGVQNTGRFCQGCGTVQPQVAPNGYNNAQRSFRCDKCGWMPTDNQNIPKFCPQCGDPFDFNDMV